MGKTKIIEFYQFVLLKAMSQLFNLLHSKNILHSKLSKKFIKHALDGRNRLKCQTNDKVDI